ncbi:MAG TPA: F0F1 ATP synthase subunit B [Verrucomicrobiae bacterium]|jgi:F-type H+-transporting ATPase subunit b
MKELGIEWPSLAAQLISFSLVFIVLWKFAYGPIFKMLQARRDKIAESLANAEKIKGDVARTEAERQKILADAGDKANKLIDEARAAAARVREVETQKAIASAEQIVSKAREAAAQERVQMLGELKREVGQLVIKTTGAVTGKVLTSDDQKRLAQETEKQLAA